MNENADSTVDVSANVSVNSNENVDGANVSM